MKKHLFKLEGLLKLRKIKEDLCKVELGKIQQKIKATKRTIEKHKADITIAYEQQKEALEQGVTGEKLKAYPLFIKEKNNIIERFQLELKTLTDSLLEKQKELARKQADFKLIKGMKEKSFQKHKKTEMKRLEAKIAEQTQSWFHAKDIV